MSRLERHVFKCEPVVVRIVRTRENPEFLHPRQWNIKPPPLMQFALVGIEPRGSASPVILVNRKTECIVLLPVDIDRHHRGVEIVNIGSDKSKKAFSPAAKSARLFVVGHKNFGARVDPLSASRNYF